MTMQQTKTGGIKPKHQRLILAALALAAVVGAGFIGASALRTEAAYFYTPARLIAARPNVGEALRLGGMVKQGSIKREADGVSIRFLASDGKADVPVQFTGIVPDLFREGNGMVADGAMGAGGIFVAEKILAKHDERYMPPSVAKEMEQSGDTLSPADMPADKSKRVAQ
jgi:cytochrome c-type biogenesis protein CcmE